MRNVFRYKILALLVIFLAVNITAQESTREEKRARKKEVRNLLKECVAQIYSEEFESVQAISDSILVLESKNPDALYYKSLSIYKTGDTTTAIETLRQGIEIAPLASRLKIFLSRILLIQNNPTDAMTLIDGVLAIKPKSPEALYLKGLAFLIQSDSIQAIGLFEQALENQIFKD